jgi:phosphotransferase system HPr-like phosphotransfer protein
MTARIAKKCRECKSKVCLSRGNFHFSTGRSLSDIRYLGKSQDPHISIVVAGNDEFPVMCDLIDIINHGALK